MRAFILLAVLPVLLLACAPQERIGTDEELLSRARDLAQRFIIVDGHIDVPYRMTLDPEDVTEATARGDFDYPRAQAGGLNAPFMSIYIPASAQREPGEAGRLANELIDIVEDIARRAPERFEIATSPADVRRHHRGGRISLPMGMENGAPIETMGDLDHFFERGIRYITLAHSEPNQLSDSSYSEERPHGGLSEFGRQVVRRMNELGIMVDVSHISDEAFYDVMEITRAPVIASHSSPRAFTPGWERNMSDALIERLAENGGVIMVVFGSSFLGNEYREEGGLVRRQLLDQMAEMGLSMQTEEGRNYFAAQRRARPIGHITDVADQIDHVVRLVGVDHVGLGSDFDGVFALPEGLQDVADFPNLIHELLRRGYTEVEIEKILGGNALRVWAQTEAVAQRGQ
jgi:membrane dipeptidase